MSAVWREDLAIGDPVIDDDHRKIIAILNEIETVVNESAGRREMAAVLERLEATCRQHFVREEDLQARIGYPYQEGHAEGHNRFLAQLADLRRQIKDAQGAYDYEGVIHNVAEALSTWFVHDILRHDQEMKPYIAKAKADAVRGNDVDLELT